MTPKEILDSLACWKKYTGKDCEGNKIRFTKYDDGKIFVYAKGRSRCGWYMDEARFLSRYQPDIPKDETEEWHKRLRRAIKCMTASGLWPNIREKFENGLLMTREDITQLKKLADSRWKADGTRATAEEMHDLCLPYSKKLPFAFNVDDDGNLSVDYNYIDGLIDCRLKSMYFGWQNNAIKIQLADAIKSHKDYSGTTRVSYDVSVKYNAEKNMAWYSEEYRNCGNGHYYLALDHNTAVFCEND